MKTLLESWDRFLHEETNDEQLDKSNEVQEYNNSLPATPRIKEDNTTII